MVFERSGRKDKKETKLGKSQPYKCPQDNDSHVVLIKVTCACFCYFLSFSPWRSDKCIFVPSIFGLKRTSHYFANHVCFLTKLNIFNNNYSSSLIIFKIFCYSFWLFGIIIIHMYNVCMDPLKKIPIVWCHQCLRLFFIFKFTYILIN